MKEIAGGISIPEDRERHIIWQCDDFDNAFAEIDIEGIWKDRTKLCGHYISQEKSYRSKTLKQSDVIALMGVFPDQFSKEQKEASFDYYDQYTLHDSSNSMCHHMIVAANIGRSKTAYEAWKRSIDIDFGKLARSSEGIHCANVGGMWQEIVFGFCGMKSSLNADILTFNPCIPEQIKKISFKVQWKQNWIRVTVVPEVLTIENFSHSKLQISVKGGKCEVQAGDNAVIGYQEPTSV